MKYILIIWVCTFLQQNSCMAPIKYPTLYDSWYECSRDAHVESVKLMSRMGYKYVNDMKIGTKYTCKSIRTYWQWKPATCTLESFKYQPCSGPESWYVEIFCVMLWPWLKQSGSILLSIGNVRSAPVPRMIKIFMRNQNKCLQYGTTHRVSEYGRRWYILYSS